jgi:hypothetical protein
MENLAPRMRARHGHKLPRSVKPHGFVPQGSKVAEIPAGPTTKIKDRIRRVAFYRVDECRVVLVDIVVSRAVPESLGKSIVIRDRRVREAPNLLLDAAGDPCGLQRPRSITETDSALEEAGFELLVPQINPARRCQRRTPWRRISVMFVFDAHLA